MLKKKKRAVRPSTSIFIQTRPANLYSLLQLHLHKPPSRHKLSLVASLHFRWTEAVLGGFLWEIQLHWLTFTGTNGLQRQNYISFFCITGTYTMMILLIDLHIWIFAIPLTLLTGTAYNFRFSSNNNRFIILWVLNIIRKQNLNNHTEHYDL